ncbi:MAG: hypothetical protein Q8K58_01905 [Acidimicrobiales bacterium]|nr:hypothetical protein [Acidimicrobiales bacterium]
MTFLAGLVLATLLLAAATTTVAFVAPAGAQEDPPRRELPGTELEAEERDDGTTSAVPWVIGSGIAAVLLIGVGGTLLSRASRRDDGPDPG